MFIKQDFFLSLFEEINFLKMFIFTASDFTASVFLQHLIATYIYFIVVLRSNIGDFNRLIYPRTKTYSMAFVFNKNAGLVRGG